MEWISVKDRLPENQDEVLVILYVIDRGTEWDSSHSYQRMIATGNFDCKFGWNVRNGLVPNRSFLMNGNSHFLKWDSVIFWMFMDEKTKQIFNKRTEDF